MPTADVLSTSSPYLGHGNDPTAFKKAYNPTHPGLLEVRFEDGDFQSRAVAMKNYKKGETIADMSAATPSGSVRYSTVQVTEKDHIELNSDLVFCNHSCDPSVRFDVSAPAPPNVSKPGSSWRIVAERDIREGEALTFFYPSTEWDMSQPFNCTCDGGSKCLGYVQGAKHLDSSILQKYFLNAHILRLKVAQLRTQKKDTEAEELERSAILS
ncbi:galactose-proton symport [Ceraceosorus bombacis]|uniref:Galactose-proton symport n=1 Tax=Ceraceosorus bombacis TaxID=401625 RepID=A0A0N7L9E0_9BASI|nr:galactose-proton symport [Ceraceosorus bombacis]